MKKASRNKFVGLPFVAVAALVAVSGCARMRKLASAPSIDRANAAFKRKDYVTAAKEYKAVTDINPKDGEAFACLGRCQMHLGNLPEAEKLVLTGLNLAPNDFVCLINASAIYLKKKNFQRAYDLATSAIAVAPYRREGYVDQANALAGLKRYRESLQAAHHALRIDRSDKFAYFALFRANLALRDYDSAIDACAHAAQLDPRDPLPHIGWSMAFGQKGKLDAALREAKWAVGLDGQDAYALRQLASVQLKLKHFADAEGTERRALQLDPSSEYAHYNLGYALKGLGKTQEARAELQKVVDAAGPLAQKAAASIKVLAGPKKPNT